MWKLKVDAEGKPVLDPNGNAIYIKPDGTEFTANVSEMFDKITTLGREAADNRKAAKDANDKLVTFDGIDPVKARDAIQTVSSYKAGDLVNATKLEEVRNEVKKTYETQIGELNTKLGDTGKRLSSTILSSAIANSPFVREKMILTSDLVQSAFGHHFSVDEGGKIIAKDGKGNAIYSQKSATAGQDADFDEALEIIVNSHPGKASLLKGVNQGGTGNNGGGAGGGSGKRVVTRAEFDKLAPADQGKTARDPNVTLTD